MVAVRSPDRFVGLASIRRLEKRRVENVNRLTIPGVGIYSRVIERPLPDSPIFAGPLPRRTGIIRNEHTAVFCFDDRVHALRGRTRHTDADLADNSRGQSRIPRDLRPMIAAIRALEQTAQRTTA